MNSHKCLIFLLVLGLTTIAPSVILANVRIGDITVIEGERTNVLLGRGLVTGLNNTGGKSNFTRIAYQNFMTRSGIRDDPLLRGTVGNNTQIKTANVSLVAVRAEIPADAKPGQRIDAFVSALDDASSLRGGDLQFTALSSPIDGVTYATAAGPVSLGGAFSFEGDAATARRNHPTAGAITGGAQVETGIPLQPRDPSCLRLLVNRSHVDWGTARRISDAINAAFPNAAFPEDAATIYIKCPVEPIERAAFIATINALTIVPEVSAKVVINEKTGTVLIGSDVRLSPSIAISHGSLSVITGESPEVAQPAPFSDGQTVVVPRTEIDVVEEKRPLTVIPETASVQDLVTALNALGVTPGDLSAIFQQLEASGHLHGTVEYR
jgi:flagellar P-ring protein precursor FlgI